MRKIFLYLFFCFFGLFLFSSTVLAQGANYSLEASVDKISLNEVFIAQIFISSANEVNVAHLEIAYSPDKLSLDDISFTNSVLPGVVEKDTSSRGLIKLTSFDADAFQGPHGLLVSLKFKAEAEGLSTIEILPESKIHLADGQGTDVFHYEASKKILYTTITGDTSLGGDSSGAENLFPYQSSPSYQTPAEESTPKTGVAKVVEKIASLIKVPIDFVKEKMSDKETVSTDRAKEELYFPEKDTVDYTQDRQTKLKKFINEVKVGGSSQKNKMIGLSVLIFILILIIVGLPLFLFLKKKESVENEY